MCDNHSEESKGEDVVQRVQIFVAADPPEGEIQLKFGKEKLQYTGRHLGIAEIKPSFNFFFSEQISH